MPHSHRWIALLPMLAALAVAACRQGSAGHSKLAPAEVKKIAGTDLSRVILTAKAADRLGIATATVREMPSGSLREARPALRLEVTQAGAPRDARVTTAGARRVVVPYSAVLYDAKGEAWVYTNPEPLVFVRHRIKIDFIQGDLAVLSDGPSVGTAVVTLGAAELFGTEFEVGH